MDYLIAPTLFQNKTCRLPGIGTFTIVTNSAEIDNHHKQINAPVPSIVFTPLQDDKNGFNEFTALSELIKKELHARGKVYLKGIGDFVKKQDGSIGFNPIQLSPHFTPPVVAEIITRQDADYARLAADKETTAVALSDTMIEEEIVIVNDRWWLWAIGLGTIGLAVLIYYISQHGFNLLGNEANYKLSK
jgi:hypothetical protein